VALKNLGNLYWLKVQPNAVDCKGGTLCLNYEAIVFELSGQDSLSSVTRLALLSKKTLAARYFAGRKCHFCDPLGLGLKP
jgi:hypothetical protein